MPWIDTHTHLFLEEFNADRTDVVQRAISAGVEVMLMPNVDVSTVDALMKTASSFPKNCWPMMGLHPTSVKEDYNEQLEQIEQLLRTKKFIAVGETGIDLYWDKSFFQQQVESFKRQIELALELSLPIVIHSRESLQEIFDVLESYKGSGLTGVFHCFPGNIQQAEKVIDMGFVLGIGGVVTFKNSMMGKVVEHVGLEHLVLETDSPYLAPAPHRGKRNQSAYIPLVGQKVAELTGQSTTKVAEVTTYNARRVFGIK